MKYLIGQGFYYFSYGSNLLKERIQLSNKSACYIGIGVLKNYSLDFVSFSNRWNGAVATIIPSLDDVWGTIWKLDSTDLNSLDAQEGVPKLYNPNEVTLFLENDESKSITCRTYIHNSTEKKLPSPYYVDIILRGAIQSNLPSAYIEKLRSINHNKNFDECKLYWIILKSLQIEQQNCFQIKEIQSLMKLCDLYID